MHVEQGLSNSPSVGANFIYVAGSRAGPPPMPAKLGKLVTPAKKGSPAIRRCREDTSLTDFCLRHLVCRFLHRGVQGVVRTALAISVVTHGLLWGHASAEASLQPKHLPSRIVDRRVLHLIKMWLESPVEETDDRGRKTRTTEARDNRRGIPQGSPISPLLANAGMDRPWAASGDDA